MDPPDSDSEFDDIYGDGPIENEQDDPEQVAGVNENESNDQNESPPAASPNNDCPQEYRY